MTSFISCYQDLANQIARLRINDTPSTHPSHQKNRILMVLTNIIQHTPIKANPTVDVSAPDVYQFSNLYDTIPMDYDILAKVKFHHAKKQISVFGIILKNGVPIRIQNRNQRTLLNHFLLRINAGIKYGSFKLNPLNGEITLCFNSVMSAYQYENLLLEPSKCVNYVENELLKLKFFLRIHWYKIMHLANHLPINYPEEPSLSNIKARIVVANVHHKLEMIKKIVPYMHLQFPFMLMDQGGLGRGPKAEEIKKLNLKIQHTGLQCKQIHPELYQSFKLMRPFKNTAQIPQKFDEKEKKQFINSLASPSTRYRQGQPCQIYSQINIISSKGWEVIDQGGFGVISKGVIEVIYPSINSPSMKRLIVRKEDHMPNKEKLTHEKKIIEKMKDKISPFIAKFFYSQQEEWKNSLFIELCAHKSLANYRMRFKQVMSLQTKLNILKYLAQGLKFLKDLGICHLDIKPSNILFGSTHVKITDFGQSFHKDVCQKNFRPGTSLPYAPPQSFSPIQINYNDRLDVFSFGMLMFQLLFECYPFQYNKNKTQLLRKSYMQKSYGQLMIVTPEKLNENGYRYIMDSLALVAMKCLEERDSKRPCIEWIIIILQICSSILSYLHF